MQKFAQAKARTTTDPPLRHGMTHLLENALQSDSAHGSFEERADSPESGDFARSPRTWKSAGQPARKPALVILKRAYAEVCTSKGKNNHRSLRSATG
jgi:hypothetical protein